MEKYDHLRKKVIRNYSLNAQTALSFRTKLNNCKIFIISDTLTKLLNNLNVPSLRIINLDSQTNSFVNKIIKSKSYYLIPSANSLNIII